MKTNFFWTLGLLLTAVLAFLAGVKWQKDTLARGDVIQFYQQCLETEYKTGVQEECHQKKMSFQGNELDVCTYVNGKTSVSICKKSEPRVRVGALHYQLKEIKEDSAKLTNK